MGDEWRTAATSAWDGFRRVAAKEKDKYDLRRAGGRARQDRTQARATAAAQAGPKRKRAAPRNRYGAPDRPTSPTSRASTLQPTPI